MNELIAVPFYGDVIHAVLRDDGMPMIPIPRICENLGIDEEAQRKRIKRDQILDEGSSIIEVPSHGGPQNTLCLPLNLIPGWLFGIGVNQIADERTRDRILVYKRECHVTLYQRFFAHDQFDEDALLTRFGGVIKAVLLKTLEERIPQEMERRWELMEAQFLASHRHVATDRVTALDCVVDWGGEEPSGRRSPVRKVGNALRRICNLAGIPIRTCDRTGVDLFPYDVAHKYMCEKGHKIVKEFMDGHSAQGVLKFPDRRMRGAHRTGKRA